MSEAQTEQSMLEQIRGLIADEPIHQDDGAADDQEQAADDQEHAAQVEGDGADPLGEVDVSDLKLEHDTENELAHDGPPSTFEEMAERLGMKPADLYQIAVPMRDGAEPMTLGQMKDLAFEAGDVEARAVEIAEQRTEFENSMIRQRQELEAIVRLLPQVPRELIEKAQAAQVETLQTERERLMAVKPEWRDDGVFQAAKAEIMETVTEYGFTRSDLESVVDHRLTKLLHDYATLRKRVAAAQASAKRVSEGQPRQGRRVSERQVKAGKAAAAARQAKQTGRLGDQVNAVHQVLAGES